MGISDDHPRREPRPAAAATVPAIATTTGNPLLVRCESCGAMVKATRYANHIRKVHEAVAAGRSKNAHARRLCGVCNVIVDAALYDAHITDTHGAAQGTNRLVPKDRHMQGAAGIGKLAGASEEKPPVPPPKTTTPRAGWFIDGRVWRPNGAVSSPAASKATAELGRSVKCARCGLLIEESEFKHHWDKAHPELPSYVSARDLHDFKHHEDKAHATYSKKKPIGPAKALKKKKKKKHKAKKKQERNSRKWALSGSIKAPGKAQRVFQGGLCSPR